MPVTVPLMRRRAVVGCKVETTEGSAESLSTSDDTMLVYDPKYNLNIDRFDRNPARAFLSRLASVIGKQAARIQFRTELKGSGSVATAPSWDAALKSAGFARSVVGRIGIGAIVGGPFVGGETVTGGTSNATGRVVGVATNGDSYLFMVVLTGTFQSGEVLTGGTSAATATTSSVITTSKGFEYKTTSATEPPSVTLARYQDGVRSLIYGARGNMKLAGNVGQPLFMDFDHMGVYDPVADVAVPEPTYETTVPPAYMDVALTVNGYAPVFTGATLDMKNSLAPRENANSVKGLLSVFIADKNPQGGVDPEMTTVADNDWFGKLVAGTMGRMSMKVGSAEGNTIWVVCPQVQFSEIGDGNRSGISVADIGFECKAASVSTGDNDVIIAML